MSLDHHFEKEPTAIRTNLGAIFVSLELSRSTWLITSLSPGAGEKMLKHGVSAGNVAALLTRLSELKQKAYARTGKSFRLVVIQEAGLDGFWIHRVLQSEGVESHVADTASIATSRRRRRAKTDKIDGEALVRVMSDQMLAVPLAMLGSSYEQPVPIFQQLSGGHPSGGDDVREIPIVAAQRRRSPGRARDRHQPRDRPVLVESVWPNVRRRDPQETRRAHARLHPVALAFG